MSFRLARRTVALAATLLAATTASHPLSAQQTDQVPRRLALALVAGLSGQADIRVGEAVPDLPQGLLPDGSEILGSMITPTMSRTVVAVGDESPRVGREMRAFLAREGWVPAHRPGEAELAKGFLSSGAAIGELGYCLGGRHLQLGWLFTPEPGSMITVTIERSGNNLCAAMEEAARVRVTRDASPVPALLPPPNAGVVSSGGGGGSGRWEYHGTLGGGALSAAGLLEHYGRQLEAAGWTVAGEAAQTKRAGVRTFEHPGDPGDIWTAALVVTVAPNDSRADLSLTVWRR
ncbi:MAG: hypothetical protein R2882_02840 [Gemmatimonadales bacterium]